MLAYGRNAIFRHRWTPIATDFWKPRNTPTTLKQEKDNDPKDESAAIEFHRFIPCKPKRRDGSFVSSKGELGDVED